MRFFEAMKAEPPGTCTTSISEDAGGVFVGFAPRGEFARGWTGEELTQATVARVGVHLCPALEIGPALHTARLVLSPVGLIIDFMGAQAQPVVNLERYVILDGLFEGCQVIGFDWRYLYVNRAVERHARKTRDELIGAVITDSYPDIEKTALFAMLRRCMETRTTGHLETEFTFSDGATAWFELRVEPVPEGIFVLSLDITAHRHAEQSIKQQLERVRSLCAFHPS